MDRAAKLYNQHLAGFPFGTPHFRLWGAVQDIQQTRQSPSRALMAWLANEKLLNAFRMETGQMESYLDQFTDHPRPGLIAYVDALEQIVRHAQQTGRDLPSFSSIITTGGTLTDETAALLHEAFGARVHNQYGSRDCGALGCSCDHGLIHTHAPNVYIEVVDENGRQVPAGATGSVLVTFLGNRVFPIIRFEIGDMAVMGPERCPCGRPFPTLQSITCRKSDMIYSTTGGYVSPVFIRHMIGVEYGKRHFRRFQFVQTDRTAYRLTIQPEGDAGQPDLEGIVGALRTDLLRVLGSDAGLDIVFSDSIPEADSGKFRYVINQYRTHP
jgi:phenylacetate-CoA ligase